MRNSSGGSRQRAWDALREHAFATVTELAEHIGAPPTALRAYIAALEVRGYIAPYANLRVGLARCTGPRAPSWSIHTDDFRDWNLDPAMSGAELGAAIEASGLSISGWLKLHGRHSTGGSVDRIRQMINGQRPVSQEVASLVACADDPSGVHASK